MPTFIMLTRVTPGAKTSPGRLEDIETQVMGKIRQECGEVEWMQSYAVLGPYDYLDVFRAPDMECAAKIATIIRTMGHAHAEVWGATEWQRFKEIIRDLEGDEKEEPADIEEQVQKRAAF